MYTNHGCPHAAHITHRPSLAQKQEELGRIDARLTHVFNAATGVPSSAATAAPTSSASVGASVQTDDVAAPTDAHAGILSATTAAAPAVQVPKATLNQAVNTAALAPPNTAAPWEASNHAQHWVFNELGLVLISNAQDLLQNAVAGTVVGIRIEGVDVSTHKKRLKNTTTPSCDSSLLTIW
jgi:hypothetical protein